LLDQFGQPAGIAVALNAQGARHYERILARRSVEPAFVPQGARSVSGKGAMIEAHEIFFGLLGLGLNDSMIAC
jgi:hypothetical protein